MIDLINFLSSYPIVAIVIGVLLVVSLSYSVFLTIRDIRSYNKSCEVHEE